jgi:hypothetical protein
MRGKRGPVKAIETAYAGCRFRSRAEARWAVFLDSLGLDWEFEPQGYELSYGRRYLPDFRVEGSYFIEVKGQRPTAEEFQAATDICLNVAPLIIFCGDVPRKPLVHPVVPGSRSAAWKFVSGAAAGYPDALGQWWACGHAEAIDHASGKTYWTSGVKKRAQQYSKALTDAKGARFEFGEKGAAR